MQIVLLTVSYSIMKYRISSISTDYQAFNYKFSSFELSVRKYLKSGELEEEIKNKTKIKQRKESLMKETRPTHPSIINFLQHFQRTILTVVEHITHFIENDEEKKNAKQRIKDKQMLDSHDIKPKQGKKKGKKGKKPKKAEVVIQEEEPVEKKIENQKKYKVDRTQPLLPS